MFKNYIEVNLPLLFFRIIAVVICIFSIFVFQISWFADASLVNYTPEYYQYGELWNKIYTIYFDRGRYIFSVCSVVILALMISGWKSYRDSKKYGIISFCFSVFLLLANYITLLIMTRFSMKCWGDWPIICFVVIGILTVILAINLIYYIKMYSNIEFGAIIKRTWMVLLICFSSLGIIVAGYIKTYSINSEDLRVRYSTLREQYLLMAYRSFFQENYDIDYYISNTNEIGNLGNEDKDPAELYIIAKFISYYDNVDGEYDYNELVTSINNVTNNSGDWKMVRDFYDSYIYVKESGIRDEGFANYHASTEFDLVRFPYTYDGAYTFISNVIKRLYEQGYTDYNNLDYEIIDEACEYVRDTFEENNPQLIPIDKPLVLAGELNGNEYEFSCPKDADYLVYNVTTTDTYIIVELLTKVGYTFSPSENYYSVNIDGITYTDYLINEPTDTTYEYNQYMTIIITP